MCFCRVWHPGCFGMCGHSFCLPDRGSQILSQSNPFLRPHCKRKGGGDRPVTHACLKHLLSILSLFCSLSMGRLELPSEMDRQALENNSSGFRVQKCVSWQGGKNLEGYSWQDDFIGCFIFGKSTCVVVSNAMKHLPCIPFLKCWRTRYLSMLSTVCTHLLKAD